MFTLRETLWKSKLLNLYLNRLYLQGPVNQMFFVTSQQILNIFLVLVDLFVSSFLDFSALNKSETFTPS